MHEEHGWDDEEDFSQIPSVVRQDFLKKHTGAAVTVRFFKPNSWKKFRHEDDPLEDHGEYMQLENERGEIVGLADFSSWRDTVDDIPWTSINKHTDLWGYRVREATKQDIAESGLFEESDQFSDSEFDVDKDQHRRWIVDIEINVKR